MKSINWLLIAMALFLTGCSLSDEPTVTVRVALPEESVEGVLGFFGKLDPRNKISTKYVPFDTRLDSHPKLAGYLEITGPAKVNGIGNSKEDLIAFVNGLKSQKLLPVENYYWNRDGNEFRLLEDHIRKNEAEGINQQYIVIDAKELRMVYKR